MISLDKRLLPRGFTELTACWTGGAISPFKVAAKARLRVQIFLKFCILVGYTLNINSMTLFTCAKLQDGRSIQRCHTSTP